MAKPYKFKIDMEALRGFLLSDKEPTSEQLRAVNMVINVVLIKHFGFCRDWWDDLKGYAYIAAVQSKKIYDPSFHPYPYLYTKLRNEIGNRYAKYTKEVMVDDVVSLSTETTKLTYDVALDERKFPKELSKFKKHFTGETDFKYIEISSEEALNLAMFIELHANHRAKRLPPYLFNDPEKTILCLYKYASKL